MNNIQYIRAYLDYLTDKIVYLIKPDHVISVLIVVTIFITSKALSILIKKYIYPTKLKTFSLTTSITPLINLLALGVYNLFATSHYEKKLIASLCIIMFASISIRLLNMFNTRIFAKKPYCRILTLFIDYSLWIAVIIHITDSNSNIIKFLDNISFSIGKASDISIWDIFKGLVFVLSAIIISTIITNFIEIKVAKLNSIDSNLRQIIIRVSKITVFIFSSMIVLPLIGIDITALSVIGGAVGVGIGFGLQKIASNFLSGFIILMDRSIKVGDRLIIDNNPGTITKITMRYVVMLRSDGTEVLIPNETFITTNIQNQSYSNNELRGEIICCIGSQNDISVSMQKILTVINCAPEIISDKSSVIIHRFVDAGVELKCHFWVKSPSHLVNASNYIYIELIQLFNSDQIILPQTSQKIEIIRTT